MQTTFELIEDPGHAWGKVPFAVLQELGLKLSDFSAYSYLYWNKRQGRFADFVLLEEDCDLTTFWNRYREVTGTEPKFRRRYTNRAALRYSRSYYNFSPNLREYLPSYLMERIA